MPQYDYDLFVIGAGSGGVRASRISAGFGARVAICEERYLGGTCVNVGCVPKKLFAYGADFAEVPENAAAYGWTMAAEKPDWPTLVRNKNREIERLNGIYERLLGNAGVELIDGHGRLLDAHTVEVAGKTYTSEYILIATGSWPFVPEIPGAELAITSNEAFYLESLPERIMIGGGGYIAVEFAGIFHGYGVDVTQVYRGPMFMRGFDDDIREHLAVEMRKRGIGLQFDTNITAIESNGGDLKVQLSDGSQAETDAVMFATGRVPMTEGLGLENLPGLERAWHGEIVVDEYSRTGEPNVFAIGDVTGRMGLTPVAIAEGMAVANTLFNNKPTALDYWGIPTAVFSHPNIGTVGYTEEEAREHCGAVDIYRTSFTPMLHTLTGREEKILMKLIVERATDRVVGCHMVGPDAAEIVQGLAVALKAGATKAVFDSTIGIHPTAAEEFVTMRTPVQG